MYFIARWFKVIQPLKELYPLQQEAFKSLGWLYKSHFRFKLRKKLSFVLTYLDCRSARDPEEVELVDPPSAWPARKHSPSEGLALICADEKCRANQDCLS